MTDSPSLDETIEQQPSPPGPPTSNNTLFHEIPVVSELAMPSDEELKTILMNMPSKNKSEGNHKIFFCHTTLCNLYVPIVLILISRINGFQA